MPTFAGKALGLLFFIGFVAADLCVSHVAAVKVAGVACVFCGLAWIWKRSIGVGIEARPPSFFLTGLAALLAGLAMLALGLALMFQSAFVACVLGWSTDAMCR